MKKNLKKIMASFSAMLVTISVASISASASDYLVPTNEPIELSSELTALLTANGYSAAQLQMLRTQSLNADHYIAYFNMTDDPNLLDDFYMYSGGVTSKISWASTQTYDGFILDDEFCGFSHDITPSGYTHSHYERFTFTVDPYTAYDSYNLIRYKLHGSGTITTTASDLVDFTPVSMGNVYDYISCGTVEAGNVTKYISGSTNTQSVIDGDDVNRVLAHFGCVITQLDDPGWTDAASIAADVDFDGDVDSVDALKLSNCISLQDVLW